MLMNELEERKSGTNVAISDRDMFSEEQDKKVMFDENFYMIGDPCYQPYRCLDYKVAFNNSNRDEEMHTKILLNLPMVPTKNLDKVCLCHDAEFHSKLHGDHKHDHDVVKPVEHGHGHDHGKKEHSHGDTGLDHSSFQGDHSTTVKSKSHHFDSKIGSPIMLAHDLK